MKSSRQPPPKKQQEPIPTEFIEFWKNHEHSGFYETPDRKWRWNITPREAWMVDRYRAEFGSPSRYEWKSEELSAEL
jgi:hypothetical protein